MSFLTAEEFKAAATVRPYKDVPVPELKPDAIVRVRCFTALDKDRYDGEFWSVDPDTKKPTYSADGARARLLVLTCENEDGSRMFTDADVAWLMGSRADVADRLFDAAQNVCGLRADLETLKNVFGAVAGGASS